MKLSSMRYFMIFMSCIIFTWNCKLLTSRDSDENVQQGIEYIKISTISRTTGAYTTVRQDANIIWPQFVLDGSYVLYREDNHYEVVGQYARDISRPSLKMAKSDGTLDLTLINGKVRDLPAISIDGTKAAVMINDTNDTGFSLSVVDLISRAITRLKTFSSTSQAAMPCFTSNGQKIVYVDVSGNSKLISIAIASSFEQTIRSSDSVSYCYPKSIPTKGELLYFETPKNAFLSRLYVMNDDGSDVVYLDSVSAVNNRILPLIWEDGSVIGYNLPMDGIFAFINPDGTGKQLYTGTFYSLRDFMSTANEVLVDDYPYLSIFNRNTGSATQLTIRTFETRKYCSITKMFLVDTNYALTIFR